MNEKLANEGRQSVSRFVVYPVTLIGQLGKKWKRSKRDFFRGAKPVARAFGISGRKSPLLIKSFTPKVSVPKAKSAWLHRHPTAGFMVLVEWDCALLTKLEHEEIDSPNRLSVSHLLRPFGLRPNSPLVTKAISATYPGNHEVLTWRGLNLQIPGTESNFVVEEAATRLLMAIGLERGIVDQASSYLVSRIRSVFLARKHLASLHGWISHLAIENKKVRSIYQKARKKLYLDERNNELVGALQSIVAGSSHAVITGLTVGGTALATSASGMTFGVDPLIFGYLGLFAGVVAWAVSKRAG